MNSVSPREMALVTIEDTPPQAGLTRQEKLAKVWNVVKWILIAIANVALFFLNPPLWAIGFAAGLAFSKKVEEMIDKVIQVWKEQPLAMTAVTVVGGFFAIEVALAAASITFGAHLGSTLSRLAQERAQRRDQEAAAATSQ